MLIFNILLAWFVLFIVYRLYISYKKMFWISKQVTDIYIDSIHQHIISNSDSITREVLSEVNKKNYSTKEEESKEFTKLSKIYIGRLYKTFLKLHMNETMNHDLTYCFNGVDPSIVLLFEIFSNGSFEKNFNKDSLNDLRKHYKVE